MFKFLNKNKAKDSTKNYDKLLFIKYYFIFTLDLIKNNKSFLNSLQSVSYIKKKY